MPFCTVFFKRLRTWLRGLPRPAAVMAVSDIYVAEAVNACRAEGIQVPERVAAKEFIARLFKEGRARRAP